MSTKKPPKTHRPHAPPPDPNAPGALPYLAAAAALLTRDPEEIEVTIVNALRETPGAAEVWSRWLPVPRGSSAKRSLEITLRLSVASPRAKEYIDKITPELQGRLRMAATDFRLRIAELVVKAPEGAPSLIWSAVHDAEWQKRVREQAWTAGGRGSGSPS